MAQQDPTFKYLPKPKGTPKKKYVPKQSEIEESLRIGRKSEAAAKEEKIRSLAASLTKAQKESLQSGENFLGWDSEKKRAYYGTPQPVLKPGVSKKQRLHETSTSTRPQRTVARDLSYIGTPGMNIMGVPLIAAKGAAMGVGAVVLTNNMNRWLSKQKTLKTLGDIPDAFSPQAIADRSRKLFGKNPKQLAKKEEAVVWGDLVDQKNFAPSASVKRARDVQRSEAADKLSQAERTTERQREGAGIKATLKGEETVAEAVGTPAVQVGAKPAATGGRRAQQRTGPSKPAARVSEGAAEGRAVVEDLRETVTRQADAPQAKPSMAGEKLTPQQVAGVGRKSRAKTAKATTRASDQEAKRIGSTADGVDAAADPAITTRAVDALQRRLDKVKDTASPEVLKTIQAGLTKLKNRIDNTVKAAGASEKRTKLQQAAERKAASEAAEPANAAKAVESFNAFLKLKPAEQKSIGKRAAAMAKKPWEEMTGAERRRFVHAVWTTPEVGRLPRHATPKQRSVVTQRRERVGSQRRQRAARETQAADVASQKEAATAKAAAKEAEAAKKVGPIEAVERGARQVVTATPKAFVAGGKKGKELAGKAWRGELSKKAPLGSAALAAGTGAAYLAKKHFVESEEEAMTEAAQKKLDAAGISVPKALGRKKIKDAKIKASRAHDKVGWYGDPITKWPKNWLSLYKKMHEWGGPGWAARPSYLDYLQDLNKSPKQGRATAAKDFARMVQKLINRKVLQPDTLNTSYGDNDTAADFDLEALGSILNKKAAK